MRFLFFKVKKKLKHLIKIDIVAGGVFFLAIICICVVVFVRFPAYNHFNSFVRQKNTSDMHYLYVHEFGVDLLGENYVDDAFERINASIEKIKKESPQKKIYLVFQDNSICKVQTSKSLNLFEDTFVIGKKTIILEEDEDSFKKISSKSLVKTNHSEILKIKDFKINGESFAPIVNGKLDVELPKKIFPSVVEVFPVDKDVEVVFELNGILSRGNIARIGFLRTGEYKLRIRLKNKEYVKFITLYFSVL